MLLAPRRALLLAAVAAVALHALTLPLARRAIQPPSRLKKMAPTFYTRQLAPQTPAAPPAAPAEAAATAPTTQRHTRHIAAPQPVASSAAPEQRTKTKSPPKKQAEKSPQKTSQKTPEKTPEKRPETKNAQRRQKNTAKTPKEQKTATRHAALKPAQTLSLPSAHPTASAAQKTAPKTAQASEPAAAFLKQWPGDTRLTYQLGGWYRGELHGSAQVLWQRQGAHYQANIVIDVGMLLHMHMSSQGDIAKSGLLPHVYEEQVRQKRRSVRIQGNTIHLGTGERVPNPGAVQDTASQLVELAQRFASGRERLAAGRHIELWLARTASVQHWRYEILGEETLHLPRLGAVRAWHLRPVPPPGKQLHGIRAELWFAPALQYLPVRILITQTSDGEERRLDLIVKTIDQREGQQDAEK